MAKATNSGVLSVGLVSVPVKFYTAAKSEQVNFNMLTADGNPIKQVLTDKVTGEGVTRSTCIKGYKVGKNNWVSFSKEEMEKLAPEKSKAIEIKEFITADELHPMAIAKTHYLGPGPGGEKAYGLFSQAMETKGVIAIAQWTNRTKDYLVAIRPFKHDGVCGLIIQELYYPNEIRDFGEIGVSNTVGASDAEVNMAGMLIDSLIGKYDASKYSDEFSLRVEKAVEEKLAGQEITAVPTSKENVLDLLAALQASLAETSKQKIG